MKSFEEFINESNRSIWVKKYNDWNTQNGTEKPAYKKATRASVLEFFQNNDEDNCTDENIEFLLSQLSMKKSNKKNKHKGKEVQIKIIYHKSNPKFRDIIDKEGLK